MLIKLPKDVETILTTLHNNGYESYIVGGCVRDALLNKIDSKYKLAYAAAKRAKIIEQEEYTSYEDGMCVKPVGQALEEILVDQTKMTFK